MNHELNDQAGGNNGTGNIGGQPPGIPHDLQRGKVTGLTHLKLIVGQSFIAQGAVHVDERLAILGGFRIFDPYPA